MPTSEPNTERSGAVREHRYDAAMAGRIETAWQQRWDEQGLYTVPSPGDAGFDADKPKFYALDMFPYPSGAGLHVGHPEGYTATDIVSRYKRMRGFNVLHPMGFDAFGLPAEQYAIQTGVHPAITTRKAIDNFRRQLKRLGFCYDWSREFATIDEDYYRWTQWIFLKLYNSWFDAQAGPVEIGSPAPGRARPIEELIAEFRNGDREVRFNPDAAEIAGEQRGRAFGDFDALDEATRHAVLDSYRLAYVSEQTVNWCPKLGTALANEEVIDGRSERGGFPVLRKPLRQWMLRITAYAERLLAGLDGVDWPTSTATMQREWIGRSEGAEVVFPLAEPVDGAVGRPEALRIYTTRPDTIFGATYMVVAPEHPLVDATLAAPPPGCDEAAVRAYVEAARNRSDVERQEAKEKTGTPLGVSCVNPATGERIPVWVADYVLMGYGTGAIMAVPAGDERDFEFASAFGLPIRDVVYPTPVAAMAFYAQQASDEERADPGSWRTVLADLLGIVTSRELAPDGFPDALAKVRTRRRGGESTPKARASRVTPEGDQIGAVGLQRGVIRAQYLETVESLFGDDFDGFREMFDTATYHQRQGQAFTAPGWAVNSSAPRGRGLDLDGLPTAEAKPRAIEQIERLGVGVGKVNYRLRDWLFSRQRYWGEPAPIVATDDGLRYPVGEHALPVVLPELADYEPVESDDPQPLLAKATDWVRTTAGEAGVSAELLAPETPVTRETNTMPGWAGSCWYHLRYCSASEGERFVNEGAERYWMNGGVDLYVGGAEHAVLHLLYARFWHKVLFDLGYVGVGEPYRRLFHQGLILSHAYQRKDKSLVAINEVEERGENEFFETATGEAVARVTAKMSKSLKNVVNPDEIIESFGADTFRLYEMYMGPLEAAKPWNTDDTVGLMRFLQRAWRLAVDEDTGELKLLDEADDGAQRALHRAIDKIGGDIEKLSFNTAIASMIEFVNAATSAGGVSEDQLDRFTRVLAPFAPHIAEELWSKLRDTRGGREGSVHLAAWPEPEEQWLVDEAVEVAVQLLGKVKTRVTVPAGLDAKGLEDAVLALDEVRSLIEGKTVRKVIAVPDRLVNIVAN